MTRYVLVDFEKKSVEPKAHATEQLAWKYACELARKQERSPNEWDILPVEIEVY